MCPVLYKEPVIDDTCKMSDQESELYPECIVTRDIKVERESQ